MQLDEAPIEADPLGLPMAGILAHPAFDDAALRYVENVIAWRQNLGLFNRVGTNLGFHVINYAMYLHLASRSSGSGHGATFSEILAICEARGQCGPRALRTVLAVLLALGQLHMEHSQADRRVRTYVPSDRLIAEARQIYGYSMTVVDALAPGHAFTETIKTEPTFYWRLIAQSGRAIVEDGVRITEHFPELDAIITQAGGLPTTISLAHAQMQGVDFPSPAVLARRFSISQSQVRSVIKAAQAARLITRSADGRVVEAHRLVDQHKGLIAREVALHVKYALRLENHFIR